MSTRSRIASASGSSAPGSSTSRRTCTALRQVKTPYEQKAAGRERRHLCRGAHRGHAGGAAGALRARGRIRDRERLPGARRDGAGLSVDRRQRPERHDAPLLRLVPADERGRPAARRRRRQLPGPDRRHHAHLSGRRAVHAAAAGDLRARARGAGCRDEGRADRREDARHRARLGGGRSRKACSSSA